jgi:hypothetical protein
VPHQSRRKDVVREQAVSQSLERACGVLRADQTGLADVLIYRGALRAFGR